ncbi:MAG: hypothetical protein RMM51_11240, partial [Verrucomicrobiae bacterium]|nr:hypothetical protein [Verrucomicrobiae bacterium]
TNIRGGTTIATGFWVNQNLADGSPLLPGGDGRFQNGWIRVGVGAGQTNLWVEANGTNFVRNLVTGFYVPFRITKGGRPPVTGNVRAMERGVQSVRVYLHVTGGQLSGAYKDGTLEVAGVATNIVAVNAGQSLVTVPLGYALPFVLHDDDDDGLLPKQPITALLSVALAEAFIEPRFDTMPIHSTNAVFHLNLETPDAAAAAQNWLSRPANKEDFWVVYVLNAYQGPRVRDGDPDREFGQGPQFGRTISPVGGSLINLETCRDLLLRINTLPDVLADFQSRGIDLGIFESSVVVHEVGHAVSGSGLEVKDAQGNYVGDGVTTGQGRYLPQYLELLRSTRRPMPQ